MKAFNTIASIILIIAVGFLFIEEFSTEEEVKDSRKKISEADLSETLEGQDFSGVRMAYVNFDTLVEKYEYHQELRDKLEKRAKQLEAEMARKTEAFQENIAILEQQAANMTETQIQEAQLDLQRVQQRLLAEREQKGQMLMQEKGALDSLIKEDLDTILNNIKNEYDIDFILSFDPNSILLAANENYDITNVVVERLNRHYRKQKAVTEGEEEE